MTNCMTPFHALRLVGQIETTLQPAPHRFGRHFDSWDATLMPMTKQTPKQVSDFQVQPRGSMSVLPMIQRHPLP
jgi:hypothetical protein